MVEARNMFGLTIATSCHISVVVDQGSVLVPGGLLVQFVTVLMAAVLFVDLHASLHTVFAV